MKCPKCAKQIAFDETTHEACGWNVRAHAQNGDEKPHKPCAHSDCPHPAILSRKLATGWADLCKIHDLFHAQLEAEAFLERQGLVTPAQKSAYRRDKMREFGKVSPIAHWNRVMETPGLPELTYRTARRALKKLGAEAAE